MVQEEHLNESDQKRLESEINPAAQRMIDEAEQFAKRILSQMSLQQLFHFNAYLDKVKKDYYEQEARWRNRNYGEEVDPPIYRKLPDFENTDWWPIAEELFNKNDGKSMSHLLTSSVERYVREKIKANPDYIPEEE